MTKYPHVDKLIDQASKMTRQQAVALHAAAVNAEGPAWDAAGAACVKAANDSAQLEAAGEAELAAWEAGWVAVYQGTAEIGPYSAGLSAGRAALALAFRDLITVEQFATLTAPWVSVMGEL